MILFSGHLIIYIIESYIDMFLISRYIWLNFLGWKLLPEMIWLVLRLSYKWMLNVIVLAKPWFENVTILIFILLALEILMFKRVFH